MDKEWVCMEEKVRWEDFKWWERWEHEGSGSWEEPQLLISPCETGAFTKAIAEKW